MKHKWIPVLVSLAIAMSVWGAMPAEKAWAATCNWTGNVSTDWATAGNWDCGTVPGASDAAVIGPATNNPIILANATVGTVTINAGGLLTYSGGSGVNLTITTFNINDGGTYIHNRAAVVPLNTAVGRNFSANSTVEIQNFNAPSSALPAFGNLRLNSTATLQMSGYLATVNGHLTKLNTGEFRLANTQSVGLTIGGNLDVQNGTLTFQNSGTANVTVAVSGNLSVNSGATLQSGGGTGIHQVNVMGNWTNNGTITLNAAAGTGVTFNGASEQNVSGTSATAFRNLLIASGAKVVMPTNATATTLTNNGTITQTQTVIGAANVTFIGIDGYGGIILNANNSDLGTTTVAIKGNQACNTGVNQLIHRCFNISPVNNAGRNATITFFFTDSELNGSSCASMEVYHWNGTGWDATPLARDTTYGPTSDGRNCTSNPRSIRVIGVATFSPFGLSSGGVPTAVTLLEIKAVPSSSPIIWPVLAVSIIVLSAAFILRRRSRAA
jgi:hypothetical protein